MHIQYLLLLLTAALLATSQEPEFIDFTYTQLLEETHYTVGPKEKIIIEPDTQHLEKSQFPQVCQLQDLLKEGTDTSGAVDNIINKDDYLDIMREKILQILKLAEEIRNTRSYLEQISKHLELREEMALTEKFKSQLQSLAKRESQLSVSKQKIQNLTQDLNRKINDYNNNPKNEQFKAVSLNYDIENCNSKINYLRDLKQRSIAKANSQPQTNFTDFFTKLGFDLRNESEQIEFIDKYFQNVSHLNYLKDTAHSLRDNIEVDRLNIEYKISCQKERQDIINKSSSHAEIKATLSHLREKKKEFGNTTNKYCEGVALKLEMQIKRLLKAVNWTFMCADGLDDLTNKRQVQIKKLQELEKQIEAYSSEGFDNYQKQYEKTKNLIQSKLQEIKTFTIDEYTHDPAYIEEMVKEVQKQKREAQDKLKKLPQQMKSDHNFDQIRVLADQIKKQKAQFCHEYSIYDTEQRKLWFLIYTEEQIRIYSSKMREQFLIESRKLRDLQSQYKQKSEAITKELTDSHQTQ